MNTTGRACSHGLRHRVILAAGPGRWRRMILALLVVLIGYAAADLFWPLHRDLSRFDPIATGTLETKIWRSYYDRQHVALFLELAQTLRTQYHFPWLRSYVGAYYGASAAFTFKEGKERSDYEKALPALQTYFSLIRNTGNRDFDVSRTTALELEWWIVHRQRERYPPGALGSACAEAAASLYRVPRARHSNTASCARKRCCFATPVKKRAASPTPIGQPSNHYCTEATSRLAMPFHRQTPSPARDERRASPLREAALMRRFMWLSRRNDLHRSRRVTRL
jgi:hypothetical protein